MWHHVVKIKDMNVIEKPFEYSILFS